MHNYYATMDQESDRVVLDRAKLHCLAHPLRSRLLAALRMDGPATSAGLAARLDTNTGATSYHLRMLAEVGLIIDRPDLGTGRERFWAAAHEITSWTESDFDDDPDDRAAAEWLIGHHSRLKTQWCEDWLASRMAWPENWRRASSLNDMRLRLNAAQVTALTTEINDLIARYRSAGPDDADTAEDVMVLLDAFPTRQLRL